MNAAWTTSLARLFTWAAFGAAIAAVAAMEWALVTHDFSARYVAENSAREVSLYPLDDDGVFRADNVLVKHSNEYVDGSGGDYDPRLRTDLSGHPCG